MQLARPAGGACCDACSRPPHIVRRWIPEGDLGTRATLDAMEELVRGSLRVELTRQYARHIMGGSGSPIARAQLLKAWLTPRYRFEPDPLELEVISAPDLQLCRFQVDGFVSGDCDDLAVLVAALGILAGLRPRFVVIALETGGPFEHVWTELWDGMRWLDYDLVAVVQGIRPAQHGARRATRALTL